MENVSSTIQEIENEIFAITGKNNEINNHWADDEEKRENVTGLLARRCNILNDVFGNPVAGAVDESNRLEIVNSRLFQLTGRAYGRIGELEDAISNAASRADEDIKKIVSRLRFVYDGEDSVLKLENDRYYGSNFTLIIKALYELSVARGADVIVSTDDYEEIDHDKVATFPFWRCKECFMDVMICKALEKLAYDNHYSAPDLCRLNNFVSEVTIVMSQTTDQLGSMQ